MFSEAMIEQMRRELENPELMKERIKKENQQNDFIENTKKMFLEHGRDFEKEFQDYREVKNN